MIEIIEMGKIPDAEKFEVKCENCKQYFHTMMKMFVKIGMLMKTLHIVMLNALYVNKI